MSGFEYVGLGLMIAAIPTALAALWLRFVTPPGAAAVAITVYMLAVGVMFTGEGAWTCVDWEDSTAEFSAPGRPPIPYSIRICARHGTQPVYLGLGAGMLATAIAIIGGLGFARSELKRRILMAVAAVLSISSLGYAYTPSGLIAGAFSLLFLILIALRNWELRPPRHKPKFAGPASPDDNEPVRGAQQP